MLAQVRTDMLRNVPNVFWIKNHPPNKQQLKKKPYALLVLTSLSWRRQSQDLGQHGAKWYVMGEKQTLHEGEQNLSLNLHNSLISTHFYKLHLKIVFSSLMPQI